MFRRTRENLGQDLYPVLDLSLSVAIVLAFLIEKKPLEAGDLEKVKQLSDILAKKQIIEKHALIFCEILENTGYGKKTVVEELFPPIRAVAQELNTLSVYPTGTNIDLEKLKDFCLGVNTVLLACHGDDLNDCYRERRYCA